MHSSTWFTEILRRLAPHKVAISLLFAITAIYAFVGAAIPLFVGNIIDELINNNGNKFLMLILGMIIVMFGQEILQNIRQVIATLFSLKVTTQLQSDIVRSVMWTKASFHDSTSKGEVIQRCIDDTNSIRNFGVETIPKFTGECVLAIIAFCVIATLYWPIAVIVLVVYFLYFIPIKRFGRIRSQKENELRNQISNIQAFILERLETLRLTKIFGLESSEFNEMSKLQKTWSEMLYKKDVTSDMFRNFPRVLDALAPALVFFIGGWKILNNDLTIGNLVTIIAYLPAINVPIRSISSTYLSFIDLKVRLTRVHEYLLLEKERPDNKSLIKLNKIQGKIEFKNVSVLTDRGYILKEVSFVIMPGEQVSFVGPTGAGKSTIVKLITGLIKPTEGEIYVDDINIIELDLLNLRRKIGTMLQDTYLVNDTVKNNILYRDDNKQEIIFDFFRKSGSENFIEKLPNGMDTIIENQDSNLSGGQKQTIGFIRAIVNDPDVLILDEATSALDTESEKKIIEFLSNYQKTCIIIAHRLSNVVNSSKIFVLSNGTIVESGNHNQLMFSNGLYTQLFSSESEINK